MLTSEVVVQSRDSHCLKVVEHKRCHARFAWLAAINEWQSESSFAIHDGWREVFPGRFKVVKPAAVELHTTMDLRCDAPTTVVATIPATDDDDDANITANELLIVVSQGGVGGTQNAAVAHPTRQPL